MKLKIKIYPFLALGISLIAFNFIGCKKFVQIPPAPNLILNSQVFADSTNANAAVAGMYIYMMNGISYLEAYNGDVTLYTGLSSDELYSTTGIPDESAAYTNALLPTTNELDATFWANSYGLIYRANAVIEGLAVSKGLSNSAKNQFLGEAKVLRAFCYFNLVNIFGSIPLVTSTDYRVNAVMPRTSTEVVYQQIINDLTDAENLLPANYPSGERLRANKFAATALLARVYLYQKQWEKAATASTRIISSGNYNLEPILNDVFLPGSHEAILQLAPIYPGFETAEGYIFVPADPTIIPSYVISDDLLNSFEPGDQRKNSWINNNSIDGTVYNYPYKYKLGNDNNTGTFAENYMVFRLAEQYLIRAEAEAEGASGGINSAVSDLNIIRKRAGLDNYGDSVDQTAVLNAVMHERQIELFCEWGHRWFDLKRTGLINSVLGPPGNVCQAKGGAWNANWALYPIPFLEIQTNHFLTQNPGY